MATISQKQKAELFRGLHHSGKMLILANIWDPLGALLMESLGYPAIATASAAVAFANGYDDGENIPFTDLLLLLKKISLCVDLPVTADIESGFAASEMELRENIQSLIDTGIVGINIEDYNKKTNAFQSIESQCNKIRLIRKVAAEMDVPLFINARTDVYLHEKDFTNAQVQFDELVKRGLAYKAAGADGFFPIAIKQEADIKKLIAEVTLPINLITIPGVPGLKTLSKLGVARLSVGPSILKIAIKAMKGLALGLKEGEGLSSIVENEITTAYLKNLVNKKI
jgi:2-methylisocitrate lyase-like PEP mutase family enzyme